MKFLCPVCQSENVPRRGDEYSYCTRSDCIRSWWNKRLSWARKGRKEPDNLEKTPPWRTAVAPAASSTTAAPTAALAPPQGSTAAKTEVLAILDLDYEDSGHCLDHDDLDRTLSGRDLDQKRAARARRRQPGLADSSQGSPTQPGARRRQSGALAPPRGARRRRKTCATTTRHEALHRLSAYFTLLHFSACVE